MIDAMGQALAISRADMLRLAVEAGMAPEGSGSIIDGICGVASRFAAIADDLYPGVITRDILRTIQNQIDRHVALLRQDDNARIRR